MIASSSLLAVLLLFAKNNGPLRRLATTGSFSCYNSSQNDLLTKQMVYIFECTLPFKNIEQNICNFDLYFEVVAFYLALRYSSLL